MMSEKVFLTWNNVERDTLDLVPKIYQFQNRDFNTIVAVARGGLFPAMLLSQALNIRNILTVSMRSYERQTRKQIQMLSDPDHLKYLDVKNTLIVDDLVDSGNTMRYLRSKYIADAVAVTPYAKPASQDAVSVFTKLYNQDQWLVFPWEQGSIYQEDVVSNVSK